MSNDFTRRLSRDTRRLLRLSAYCTLGRTTNSECGRCTMPIAWLAVGGRTTYLLWLVRKERAKPGSDACFKKETTTSCVPSRTCRYSVLVTMLRTSLERW